MLNKFRLAHFRVEVIAAEKLILPEYKGATIRGAFGYAFKRVACIKNNRENCDECSLKSKCPYHYIFNTPVPKDAEIMKKYNYAPHPYILCPPLETQEIYAQGSEIHFSATIIGDALNYLPYFVLSFETIGKLGLGRDKGKYQLKSISALAPKGAWEEIYDSVNQRLMNNYPVIKLKDLDLNTAKENLLTIHFLTPVRLKYNDRIIGVSDDDRLEFHIIIRNLLRRIGLLSYFHCGEELDLDYNEVIEKAQSINIVEDELEWYDWGRYSQRQQQSIGMGGLIGKVSYEGQVDDFLAFIRLGELVHVGKATAFGLGKFSANVERAALPVHKPIQ